jgi:radical SAM superfamily enzyme YgiQ (UPF0313 family)
MAPSFDFCDLSMSKRRPFRKDKSFASVALEKREGGERAPLRVKSKGMVA